MIQEAIDALNKSVKAFTQFKKINSHGIALAEFQLGYLYAGYQKQLLQMKQNGKPENNG